MPSRRALLRTGGAVVGTALAGCGSLRGVEGYVQLKSIQGRATEDGRQFEESVLRVTLSSPPGEKPPEVTFFKDTWRDQFETPRRPTVSKSLHDDLRREYDTVRYVVGVCSPAWADDDESEGCYNVATTRENFNAVQVHDRVRVSSNGTYLTIHSVDGQWTFDST